MSSPIVQNFDIIIRADSFTQAAFSKTGKELSYVRQYAQEAGKSMQQLDRDARAAGSGFAASLASYAAGFMSFAAIGSAIRGTIQQLAEGRRLAIEFEKSILDLSSVGENAKDLGKLRTEVLELSAAMGRSPAEIAKLKFFIQSGTAGMTQAMVEDIEAATLKLAKLTVADPSKLAGALIKTFNLFGDEVNDVQLIMDKLFITAEKGFIEMTDLANLITRVLPAAKAFGFTLNEVLGMISLGTRLGGDPEEVLTSVRQIFLQMPNAAKEGINLTGDITQKLEELSKVDPSTLATIFGDRTVSLLLSLNDHTKELGQEIEEYGHVAGDVITKLADRAKDATATFAEMGNAFNQALKNQQTTAGSNPTIANFVNAMDAAKLGSDSTAVTSDTINDIHAFLQNALGGDAPARGFSRLALQAEKAGNTVFADKLMAAAHNAAGRRKRDVFGNPIDGTIDDEETTANLNEIMQRRKNAAAKAAMRREDDTVKRDIFDRAAQRQRDEAMGLAGGLAGRRSAPTAAESAAIEAAALDPSGRALQRVREQAERARMTGRTLDEQLNFEASAKKLVTNVGDAIRKELEARGKDKTVAGELAKGFTTLFGSQVDAIGKLFGEKAKDGTLAPLLKDAVSNAAKGILGEKGASFLGFIEPDKQRQERERREADRTRRIDDDLDDFFNPIEYAAKIKRVDDDLEAVFGKAKKPAEEIDSVFLSQNFRGYAERQRRGADPVLDEMKQVKENTGKSAAALADIARGINEGTIEIVQVNLHR